jgi:hypothetical protein
MITNTVGVVTELKVEQDGILDQAMTTVLDSKTNMPEIFFLWIGDVGVPTPFSVWIARSLVVSLLKTALVNKLKVSIVHDDTSALVQSVDLLAS